MGWSSEATIRWQKANPERVKATRKARYHRLKASGQLPSRTDYDPERERWKNIERRYGVTREQYQAMCDAQDGRCAICGSPPKKRQLVVDHDHDTGQVRGLLCSPCNLALHRFIDVDALSRYLGGNK